MRMQKDAPCYPMSAEEKGLERMTEKQGFGNERHEIMRAGGSDPHRQEFNIAMERKIADHDQSGYNHSDNPRGSTPMGDARVKSERDAESKPMRYADDILR